MCLAREHNNEHDETRNIENQETEGAETKLKMCGETQPVVCMQFGAKSSLSYEL